MISPTSSTPAEKAGFATSPVKIMRDIIECNQKEIKLHNQNELMTETSIKLICATGGKRPDIHKAKQILLDYTIESIDRKNGKYIPSPDKEQALSLSLIRNIPPVNIVSTPMEPFFSALLDKEFARIVIDRALANDIGGTTDEELRSPIIRAKYDQYIKLQEELNRKATVSGHPLL
jgi:hypothetical protein